jgi:pheromone shutdown protein TraB
MILRIQHLTIKNYHIFAYLETAREEKKGGRDYCRIHNISSIEDGKISIARVTGNSGLIFALGFFIILIKIILSDDGGLFANFIWILWGFVFLCASIVFLLISSVSKGIEKK